MSDSLCVGLLAGFIFGLLVGDILFRILGYCA